MPMVTTIVLRHSGTGPVGCAGRISRYRRRSQRFGEQEALAHALA